VSTPGSDRESPFEANPFPLADMFLRHIRQGDFFIWYYNNVMKFILIRHGETKEGKKGIILGRLPGVLSAKGKKEMEAAAKKIKKSKLEPEIIFSSDLNRAKQSAIIISKTLGLKVKCDKLLRERAGGIAEGKSDKEIDWENYEKISLLYRKHKGGENFIEVRKRAKTFLLKIKKVKFENVIIVSHSAFLAMLLSLLKKWSIKKALKFNFKNPVVV
jgi:broad specificity phosphatase PhoE